MTTKREGLFSGIVSSSRVPRNQFLGAVLALAAWGFLWAWVVAGVAAPLGATMRSGATPPAPIVAPVAPGADVVSTPPIAAAPCAC